MNLSFLVVVVCVSLWETTALMAPHHLSSLDPIPEDVESAWAAFKVLNCFRT